MISEDYLEGLIDTFDKESREEARSGSVSPGGTTSSSTLCQRRRPKSETCFPCLFCDFGTDDEKNFRKHAKKKHCEKYWECEMCSYGSQEEDDTAW